MSTRAKFVREITVIDPDSKGEVELAVYKHENGGMFAIDSSYIDQELAERAEEGETPYMSILDPFSDFNNFESTELHLED
jgi:hypothetical protein